MGFGRVLQEVREAVGLSQSELAREADVSIDSLRNWEQDRALPKIDVVTKLARAMGVSLDRLAYDGTDSQPTDAAPSNRKLRTSPRPPKKK